MTRCLDPNSGMTPAIAPSFRLPDLHGNEHASEDLIRAAEANGRDLLLVFTELECDICDVLLVDLVAAHQSESDIADLVIVTNGNAAANFLKFASLGLDGLILRQSDWEVSALFSIGSAPGAVVIAGDGTIVGGPAEGLDGVVALVGPYVGHVEDRGERLVAGQSIPNLSLTGANGLDVPLANIVRETTLLLFFEENCSYCNAMLPGLQERLPQWNAARLRVVVVTTPEHQTISQELPGIDVYREARLQASTAFGVEGTPSGALIGPDKRLLASVVLGEVPIWDLVSQHVRGA